MKLTAGERAPLNAPRFPSYSQHYNPPADVKPFVLSQDYPSDFDETEVFPWSQVDFATEPQAYMRLVLNYCLEGNVGSADVEEHFRVEKNTVRQWYHAPWLHDDGRLNADSLYSGNGREYRHGLTRERPAPPGEVHRDQTGVLQDWAVGFYNQRGGYTLGRVWLTDDGLPDPHLADFPENTVSFKLLFTSGDTKQVPFLANTMKWTANVHRSEDERTVREDKTMRLLQVDMAVKDSRAQDTGWVFGTFIYDASVSGSTVWERMVPVGLMWGDDPGVDGMLRRDGAFVNPDLKQTWLNIQLVEAPNQSYADEEAYVRFHGLGGRLNGPVDNPISSCISCHGQAASKALDPQRGMAPPLADFRQLRSTFDSDVFALYFSNVGPGAQVRSFQGVEYVTVDYSLQLSGGIRNFYNHRRMENATSLPSVLAVTETELEPLPLRRR